jgi:hypothetical protein
VHGELVSCRFLGFGGQETAILSDIELHPVDLSQESAYGRAIVRGVCLRLPETGYLAVKPVNAIQSRLKLLIVSDHVTDYLILASLDAGSDSSMRWHEAAKWQTT